MAQSPREILRRIRGITSTQQITKAMEMVAAVKLNRIRLQAEQSRPYVERMKTIMCALRSSADELNDPLFIQRPENRVLLVVITSDRGLCGTFNVNVINAAKNFIGQQADKQVSIVAIGRKGNDALSKQGYRVERFFPVPWGASLEADTRTISIYLMEAFTAEEVDSVYVLYSHFANVLRYVPTCVQYLPIPPLTQQERRDLLRLSADFIIEPSFEMLANQLTPRYLETILYHSIVESLASEYAARMVSMRNANDNAEEVIRDLTLTYNKARQASITKELIDIIGGVEALKG